MISRQYSYVIDSRCIENKGGDMKLSRELYISSKTINKKKKKKMLFQVEFWQSFINYILHLRRSVGST